MFDTLLTRSVGDPNAVLRLTAERTVADGLVAGTRSNVVLVTRQRVEADLIRHRGRPVTLPEIWDEVARQLGQRCDASDLVAVEESVERSLSRVVPGAVELVAAARPASGLPGRPGAVVFVSDTPHRSALLVELLTLHGLFAPGDQLFCSAECGGSKADGRLFGIVAGALGVEGASFTHIGDDARADLGAARLAGWSSVSRPQGRLNRYESALEAGSTASGGMTSWMAGASRLARLEAEQKGCPPGVATVAAGVAAPMLMGLALWLVAQVERHGYRRLYFLARDGEAMQAVAEPILAALAPQVECRYLYSSRHAWEVAALPLHPETLPAWVMGHRGYSARALLRRAGLETDESWQRRALGTGTISSLDEPLSEPDRLALGRLLQTPSAQEEIFKRADAESASTIAYLRQEGLGDGTPAATVDVGWRGHAARSCDILLRSEGIEPPVHLFIGVTEQASAVRAADPAPALEGWLFDEDRQRGVISHADLPGLSTLIEVLCTGTEGRVLGFDTGGAGSVTPRLTAPANDTVLAWGLPAYRDVLLQTVELTVPHLKPDAAHVDVSSTVARLLSTFWLRPTPDEVTAWARFPFEDETWPPFLPLGQAVSGMAVLRRLTQGVEPRSIHSWATGSALVSDEPWRSLLRLYGWRKQHAARLGRAPRRLRVELAARRRR